jgi:hypothetical protein
MRRLLYVGLHAFQIQRLNDAGLPLSFLAAAYCRDKFPRLKTFTYCGQPYTDPGSLISMNRLFPYELPSKDVFRPCGLKLVRTDVSGRLAPTEWSRGQSKIFR